MGTIPTELEYERKAHGVSRAKWWRLPVLFVIAHTAIAAIVLMAAISGSITDSGILYIGVIVVVYLLDMPVTLLLGDSLPGPLKVLWLVLASGWWFFLGYVVHLLLHARRHS